MPADAETPRLRASDADRDRVLTVVQEAHGVGRLDLTEVDERTSAVLAARYLDELWPLVHDLPESDQVRDLAPGTELAVPRAAPREVARADSPTRMDMAVMSGRDVVLEPGTEQVSAFQFWGGDDYDLTQVMGPGVTVTMHLVAVMAGSDILVPPGVRIVDDTLNIMAGNGIAKDARGDGSNGTLRLKGFSFWAGHDVKLAPDATRQQ